MYSAKSISGLPVIQHNGRCLLSVWDQDWDLAYELCAVLNQLEDQPELSLTEFDRKWLKAIDRAFQGVVQHA